MSRSNLQVPTCHIAKKKKNGGRKRGKKTCRIGGIENEVEVKVGIFPLLLLFLIGKKAFDSGMQKSPAYSSIKTQSIRDEDENPSFRIEKYLGSRPVYKEHSSICNSLRSPDSSVAVGEHWKSEWGARG